MTNDLDCTRKFIQYAASNMPTACVTQDLNPIPFPVVVANCVAWVGYSIVNKDPYVFMANDPGLLLGLFYTLSAYGYADAKVRSRATNYAALIN